MIQDFLISILSQDLYNVLVTEYPVYLSSMIFIFVLLIMYMFFSMICKMIKVSRG